MAYIRIKCSKCDETFGQESRFLEHLTDIHFVENHLQHYLDIHFDGVHPTCSCNEECKEKLSWMGWKKGFTSKYVRGHNARVDSVYLNPDKQVEFAQKRSEGYKQGKYSVWNSGLTKQSSEKVAAASMKISSSLKEGYDTGKITDWHILNPEKAIQVAKKVSETKKRMYTSGELVPWNLGLTKDVSNSLLKSSISISENYKNNLDASAKRLSPDEVESRINETGVQELPIDSIKGMMIEEIPAYRTRHPKESKDQ